jgi:hypothetical protein
MTLSTPERRKKLRACLEEFCRQAHAQGCRAWEIRQALEAQVLIWEVIERNPRKMNCSAANMGGANSGTKDRKRGWQNE